MRTSESKSGKKKLHFPRNPLKRTCRHFNHNSLSLMSTWKEPEELQNTKAENVAEKVRITN